MPMIEIKFNAAEIERLLNAKLHQIEHPKKLMGGIASELLSITDESFMNQASPDGTPWAKLSENTIAQRIKADMTRDDGSHYPMFHKRNPNKKTTRYGKTITQHNARTGILNVTSKLMNGTQANHSMYTATISNSSHPSFGAIHQFGGMAGAGRSVPIPARPFMPQKPNGDIMDAAARSVLEMCMKYFEANP